MKQRFILLSGIYSAFILACVVQKPLFLAVYGGRVGAGSADWWRVVWHGLPLDSSVAGYLTALPALLLIFSIWRTGRWLRTSLRVCFSLAAFILVSTFVVNIALYGYWGFPLDTTPLFYFFSSPRDALASVSVWAALGGIAAILFGTILLCVVLSSLLPQSWQPVRHRWRATFLLLLLAAALFISIRGGVTVSTMNTGRAYFSEKPVLNHAAVNPVLSLLESLSKEADFASQYRFLEPDEADRLFGELTAEVTQADSARLPLTVERPDIYLVVLESFSSHLMATLGGKADVAVCLDSIAADGLLFTNFYANSFRTDRGLVAVLSGYPAQPTTSVMKYPRKTQGLPSIARALRAAGYRAHYYYGGDADFTNMRSYLVSSGFQRIVSDHDFPLSARLSKWGVPDHLLFERLKEDLAVESRRAEPTFTVVQTSSSHEPFDVPYHRLRDMRLNAFAYTDSVVGGFVRTLRGQAARWARSLVVLVPDHLGAYPEHIDNLSPERYRIPLLLTGGALDAHGRNATYGSQTDIAATLLAALGLPHADFAFSKNLLDTSAPHYAFFTVPDAFGMVTAENTVVYDNKAACVRLDSGAAPGRNLPYGKALLQKLYDDLAHR
ncbi:MAG: sulfatase-like hydrolase/transferase [Alloprevotella sp.]|nr:sulfatase-like hydrolase/transferase [Alloprevotella sp.]